MKKLTFFTVALIILFTASQVSAVSEKTNEKATNNPSEEKRNEHSLKTDGDEQEIEVETEEEENDAIPTVTQEFKNHGEYVKSVAQTHPGGRVVSEAAKSDTGKKKTGIAVTPTVTISTTPTPTGDPTGTPTPTLTGTPTPTPVNEDSIESLSAQIKELVNAIKELLKQLPKSFRF